jgi:hypothetical protein
VLEAGQSLEYAGDAPHVWEALEEVSAVLVMRYPRPDR